MNDRISNEDGSSFWWKQLDYVFNLPDPRSFPLLDNPVPQAEREAVERFVETAGDLAESAMLNSFDRGFCARKDDATGAEIVQLRSGRRTRRLG